MCASKTLPVFSRPACHAVRPHIQRILILRKAIKHSKWLSNLKVNNIWNVLTGLTRITIFQIEARLHELASKRGVFRGEDRSDWADSAVNSSGANAPPERPCGLIQSLIRSSLRSRFITHGQTTDSQSVCQTWWPQQATEQPYVSRPLLDALFSHTLPTCFHSW